MKTDIQIAQEAEMLHIREVAAKVGIEEEDLEFYGKYKAKLSDELMERVKDRPDGKLVLVTAINPTPAGEGKTTITVGLGEAMAKLGKNENVTTDVLVKICTALQCDIGDIMELSESESNGGSKNDECI